MTKLPAMLKTSKPAKSTGENQVKETQKASKTCSVNKAAIACITLIQKKRSSITQKIQKSKTLLHKLK